MRIFLDPGHGGSDPGAAKIIKESQYTLIYALELGRALKGLGFEVNYSRTSDSDVSLAERCRMANTWKADYFISIHFNAGGGTGIETFALAAGGNAERLAKAVQSPLIAHTGMRDRGVKFANFQVLRDTLMPAVLIELGFLTNKADCALLREPAFQDKIALGIAFGILEMRA